jgi:hypothetical protein
MGDAFAYYYAEETFQFAADIAKEIQKHSDKFEFIFSTSSEYLAPVK